MESEQHKEIINSVLQELKLNGYRVFDTRYARPDLIAIKDNKLIAIEIMGRHYINGKGWKKGWSSSQKERRYLPLFDDLFIYEFRYKDLINGFKYKRVR